MHGKHTVIGKSIAELKLLLIRKIWLGHIQVKALMDR
jgi:hypothetical protein